MAGHPDQGPNFDDALATGFSEFKIGENKIAKKEITQQDGAAPPQLKESEIKTEPQYGVKIDAIESRQSFVVKPNAATLQTKQGLEVTSPAEEDRIARERAKLEAEAEELAKQAQKPQQVIMDKPSSTIGDDFDATW